MRILLSFLLVVPLAATDTPVGAVQALFDAMKAHDAAAVRAVTLPETTLTVIHDDGKPPTFSTIDKFEERVGSSKDAWLERMWNPKVLEHGPIAVVWADYDFHLNNKFHHCGIDAVNLVKTSEGWKVSGISYTAETTACTPSPLGPPDAK
jgi:hypothetical protein